MASERSTIEVPSKQDIIRQTETPRDDLQALLREKLGLPTRYASSQPQTDPEELWDNLPV